MKRLIFVFASSVSAVALATPGFAQDAVCAGGDKTSHWNASEVLSVAE